MNILQKHGSMILIALSEGTLRARLGGSCLSQVNHRGETYVSNRAECLSEINAQLKLVGDVEELSSYKIELQEFGVKNALFADQ